VLGFAMPGVAIPGFTRKARQMAQAGISDLRIHHDEILWPLLGPWDLFGLQGLDRKADQARDQLAAHLAKTDRLANRFETNEPPPPPTRPEPPADRAAVREPQWCDDPHAGLSPRLDGDSCNAEGQGRSRSVKGVAVDIIGVIIAGIIIGLLGKFFAPGDRDNIPLWLTIVCGVGGVIIGYYLAAALGVEATRGIDWIRWIISIVVAAILVVIAASVTGRRGRAV
jgi:uncharacterized membrane protein YeaQ/YmgE (transglycosylase-associated protein family)